MNNRVIASVLTAFFVVGSVWAGVVPGRWEKLQAESSGTGIIVKLTSGEEIEAIYQELGADSLLVTVAGAPRDIPKSGIAKITTAEKRSGPILNGALIGAAAGAIPMAVAVGQYSENEGGGVNAAWLLVPVGAGIGAAIGIGIDSAIKGHITLYQAPGQ